MEPGEDAQLHPLWSLREEVLVEVGPDTGAVTVCSSWDDTDLGVVSPAVRSLLQRMTLGPVSLENVLPSDADREEIAAVLDRLGGCVVPSLGLGQTNELMLSVLPLERQAEFRPRSVGSAAVLRLSRFAGARSGGNELWLESPLSRHRVVAHQPQVAAMVSALTLPTTVARLAAQLSVAEPMAAGVVSYLLGTGMLLVAAEQTAAGPTFAEDQDPELAAWPHHELMFHGRSRMGRRDVPTGIGARFRRLAPTPPVVKAVPPGRRFALDRPSVPDLAAVDRTVTDVLEDPRPAQPVARTLTVGQVGELLYRVARVRSVTRTQEDGQEISDRPYPSVDGLYELEIYVVTGHCAGLPTGVFHYDPLEHALTLVNTSAAEVGELLDEARVALRAADRPLVLLAITSRLSRLTRRYCGVAYTTTLRNTGLLQATLGLVAAAMGLSATATAVGVGPLTERVLGLDWPAEVNVGEVALSLSRPPPAASRRRAGTRSVPARAASPRARSQPAGLGGDADRVDPVAGVQLADRGREVVAHGARGEEEAGRDLRGARALGRHLQHFELPGGQRARRGVPGRKRELGVDDPQAGHDLADRVGELARRRVLEQEAAHLRRQRPAHRAGAAEAGQDQRPHLRHTLVQEGGGG
jgi:SagB-type dehydrogenase family enzyme